MAQTNCKTGWKRNKRLRLACEPLQAGLENNAGGQVYKGQYRSLAGAEASLWTKQDHCHKRVQACCFVAGSCILPYYSTEANNDNDSSNYKLIID